MGTPNSEINNLKSKNKRPLYDNLTVLIREFTIVCHQTCLIVKICMLLIRLGRSYLCAILRTIDSLWDTVNVCTYGKTATK